MTTPHYAGAMAPTEIEDLQLETIHTLNDLAIVARNVAELTDTHVRGLGFLSHDGAQALDRQTRDERRIRNENAQKGFPRPSGDIPTPGNLRALSLDAEIVFTLHHLAKRIVRSLRVAGVCAIARPPANTAAAGPDVDALVWWLGDLVDAAPSPTLLREVITETEILIERASLLVNGNDRVLLPADCPHCERRTLVVYFADGIIRCDRDPATGHFHSCVCPDSYCECHQKPVAFRHAWLRTQTTSSTGWYALADRLNLNRIK